MPLQTSLFLTLCIALHVATQALNLTAIDQTLATSVPENHNRLLTFLRFPSVSADPTRADQVRAAATWLKSDLTLAGLENARFLETPRHPAVYADWLHIPDAPTVLIYGHFDVQPEDPRDLWTTPPFEPTVREGRLYARGASDDKGHMYVPVAALRAILQTEGKLPVNVKVLFEGEEEIGSPNLKPLLQKHRQLLKADYAFSADGGQVSTDIPGICLGLRGSFSMQLSVKVADVDMHSGSFGGGVRNPVQALAGLLNGLWAPDGRIAVEGFYDDVVEMREEERVDIGKFPVNAEEKLREIGVDVSFGEEGFSFYERTWKRPAIEIVGMWGGFQGIGVKTVLPREAHAKLSVRTVCNQKLKKSRAQLRAHLETHAKQLAGVRLTIEDYDFASDAFEMDKRAGGNVVVAEVLKEIYEREAVTFMMGGSIPVFGYLRDVLGLETSMFAFGHADENVHAPDEFARLDSFRRGERAYVRLLARLGAMESGKEEL